VSDFEVEISGEAGNYRVAARSAAGDTTAVPVRFPFDDLALGRQLQALELALLRSSATMRRLTPVDEQPVQEFGRRLFDFLFPAAVRANLIASRQQAAAQGTPLRVRLRVGPAELAALPWEFLYDPGRDDYMSLSTPLVRYLDVFEPHRPLTVVPPLRVLAMAAGPEGLESLDVKHEHRRLIQALAPLEAAGRVQLSWVGGQTWWDLQEALDRGGWHIFHFIGHGGFDPRSGEGLLALADEDGAEHRIAADDLALLLAELHSLRLVVLNSCEGARASAADRFSSTASVLMRRGIPAVVAMQYEISDQAAIAFTRGFYTALATQHPVEQAVTRARRAIKLARRNTLEWATPVLYLRSATGALFDLTDTPASTSSPPHTRSPDDKADAAAGEAMPRSATPQIDENRTSATPDPSPASPAPAKRIPTKPTELTSMRHPNLVRAVAFSPDGTRLATACADKTARLWDPTTGQELTSMKHDAGWSGVTAVAFSPDGTRLATGSGDKTARLWDPATGQELTRLVHEESVAAVAFSPDGTRLATGSGDKTARLWDLATGEELTSMEHPNWVWAVAFSPDGTRLATGSGDKTARLWDPATGQKRTRLVHEGWVNAVAFSPDGTRLATGSGDMTARLWDPARGQELTSMKHDVGWLQWVLAVLAVAFSPDGTRLATGSNDKTARLWDPTTGQELTSMRHLSTVYGVAFSPDGTRLATACRDKTARVWALTEE